MTAAPRVTVLALRTGQQGGNSGGRVPRELPHTSLFFELRNRCPRVLTRCANVCLYYSNGGAASVSMVCDGHTCLDPSLYRISKGLHSSNSVVGVRVGLAGLS